MDTFFETRRARLSKHDKIVNGLFPKYGARDLLRDYFDGRFGAQDKFFWEALSQRIVDVCAEDLGVGDDQNINNLIAKPDMQAVYAAYENLEARYNVEHFGEEARINARAHANSWVQQMWHQWLHTTMGRKVYEVSPALAEYLKYTEFQNVKTDALKLPYRSVYISIPENANLFITHAEYRPPANPAPIPASPAMGISVMEQFAPNGMRSWNFLVISKPYRIEDGEIDQVIFSFDIFLPLDTSIEDVLERKTQALFTMPEHVQMLYGDEDPALNGVNFAPYWKEFFRWVMNVLLYATWPEADIEHGIDNSAQLTDLKRRLNRATGEDRERLKKELRHTPVKARMYLGRKMMRLSIPKQRGTDEEHRKLLIRCLVTGHWRNQPYGQGRSERKLIWIKPFWRGPMDGPESNPERVLLAPGERP